MQDIRRLNQVSLVRGRSQTDDCYNETCRKTTVEEKAKLCIFTAKKGTRNGIKYFTRIHHLKQLPVTSGEP
jgi:hypothetical protein